MGKRERSIDPASRASKVGPARAADRKHAALLLKALREHYPDAHCELNFGSPHELLVATILSAQATDVSVNKATPALFARFPTPADYAKADTDEIEPYIRTIGLYRNKAKAIKAAMKSIVEDFGGEVPQTMEGLLTLRGVARKTANVVLGNCFGINEGVVVDTHVQRLAVRLGLVPQGASTLAIEKRLMDLFPRDAWCDLSHMLIFHGRRACKARMASCADHPICRGFGSACELRVSVPSRVDTRSKPTAAGRKVSPGQRKGRPAPDRGA
ncbi:MAG: endonuclease III [Phycisphaeraceae bacterium]|nr:MAG: endonuclease III [Phycisphaeraceae bacterium]